MRGEQRRRTVWTAAGAGSLAAHGLLLGLAIWLMGRDTVAPEAPVVNVQLVTLQSRSPPDAQRPTELPALDPPRDRIAPRPPVTAPGQAEALPVPPSQGAADPGDGIARALRGRAGCRPGDPPRQSREERERCATQLAQAGAARDGDAPRLDLSRQGRIGKDPRFDLSTPPKNGCKFRAAGDKGPLGQDGARAGFACAWDF
ncbi:MAG: hypothetical protein AB1942_11845 [Pseudomonadota bacterium]